MARIGSAVGKTFYVVVGSVFSFKHVRLNTVMKRSRASTNPPQQGMIPRSYWFFIRAVGFTHKASFVILLPPSKLLFFASVVYFWLGFFFYYFNYVLGREGTRCASELVFKGCGEERSIVKYFLFKQGIEQAQYEEIVLLNIRILR